MTALAVAAAVSLLGAAFGLAATSPFALLRDFAASPHPQALASPATWWMASLGLLFWGSAPATSLRRAIAGVAIAMALVLLALDARTLAAAASIGEALDAALRDLAIAIALSAAGGLAWRLRRRSLPAGERALRLLAVALVAGPLAWAGDLSAALHPWTFDLHALRWDALLGVPQGPLLAALAHAPRWLATLLSAVQCAALPALVAVALLQWRGRPAHAADALRVGCALLLAALAGWHLLPLAGPHATFGGDAPVAMAQWARLPVSMAEAAPVPRSGLPALAFGGMLAATVLLWQMAARTPVLWLSGAATVLAALADLALGGHYAVDLLATIPATLAVVALCRDGGARASGPHRRVAPIGAAAWLAWIAALRWGTEIASAQPWLAWGLVALTIAAIALQVRALGMPGPAAALPRVPSALAAAAPQPEDAAAARLASRFGGLYFVSGFAALVYQVLFAKQLALVFGSTSTATLTVLATFLGGMAIGSLLGGTLGSVRHPLRVYALLEGAISVYCVATPTLFELAQQLYVHLARGAAPDAALVQFLRCGLGGLVLLVPTVAMGATLPMLTQALAQGRRPGSQIARLYFWNTAGAALGSLLTAYAVIPAAADTGAAPAGMPSTAWAQRVALLTLGAGGMLSLGLEVAYVHMLSVVAGNSVYAFGLMVATFLAGLSTGGAAARWWIDRHGRDACAGVALALLGLSVAVSLGALSWNFIPPYFAEYADYPLARGFAAREAIRAGVCALAMVPPTVFIGMAYAFGMDVLTNGPRLGRISLVGLGAAVNTLGNIAGVLLFGFAVLPALGGLATIHAIAIAAAMLGVVALLPVRGGRRWAVLGAGAAGCVALASCAVPLDLQAISSGSNVYFKDQPWGQVIDHAESIDGGFTAVTRTPTPAGDIHTLVTNGKFQGSDSVDGELQAQMAFAFASLLHQDRRERALVIGYGTGNTSRVFGDAGFGHLDIAELSGDVLALSNRHFAAINDRVSTDPHVHAPLTDGRNFLLLSPARYDVVSIEITSIWFAGAASLYSRDFYQLVKQHLNEGGVLQQWVQLHHMSPLDLLTVMTTLRSEFRYASLYVIGGQGILIATNDPARANPLPAAERRLSTSPGMAADWAIVGRNAESIAAQRLLDPAAMDRFVASGSAHGLDQSPWISTDDNLALEYSTPKGNVLDDRARVENMAMLARYAAPMGNAGEGNAALSR